MKDRIKILRKTLKMTQAEFAESINVSKSAVEKYEYGSIGLTDRTISDICRTHNVSDDWLRNGIGEIFVPLTKNQEIASFLNDVMEQDDSDYKKQLILALAEMSPAGWDAIKELIDKLKKFS